MSRHMKMTPPHVVSVDMEKLSEALRKKRGEKSLRDFSQETGLGFSTLARVENGHQPDLLTYVLICTTLEVSLETFIIHWKVTLEPTL